MSSSSSPESRTEGDGVGLAALDDVEGTKFERVLLNLSKLDICLRCKSLKTPSLVGGGKTVSCGRSYCFPSNLYSSNERGCSDLKCPIARSTWVKVGLVQASM